MDKYNLNPDEAVIMKVEQAIHVGNVGELLLTNQNLIFIFEKGLIKTTYITERYPLSNIKIYDGKAQTICGKDGTIDIVFYEGVKSFQIICDEFFSKQATKEANLLADKINSVLTGISAPSDTSESTAMSGVQGVAATLKNTTDAFKEAFGGLSGGSVNNEDSTSLSVQSGKGKYEILPNEVVQFENRDVSHVYTDGSTYNKLYTVKVMLTNLNIVVVSSKSWGNDKKITYEAFPLTHIQIQNGIPRIRQTDEEGYEEITDEVDMDGNIVEIYFRHGREGFQFEDEEDAASWASKVRSLLMEAVKANNSVAVDVTNNVMVTGEISSDDSGDTENNTFHAKPVSVPTIVKKFCTSCGNPLAGHKGNMVHCGFCNNEQIL